MVEMLINGGVDVKRRDSNWETPLEIAREQKNRGIIDLLLRAGARDVSAEPGNEPSWPAAGYDDREFYSPVDQWEEAREWGW